MDIAQRIDLAMKICGIKSQAELSRQTGVSDSSIARILKGDILPSLESLAAIAKACNVSMDWLMTGEQDKTSDVVELPLIHVTQRELKLLSQHRESTERGKRFIESACEAAEKRSDPTTNQE